MRVVGKRAMPATHKSFRHRSIKQRGKGWTNNDRFFGDIRYVFFLWPVSSKIF